MGQFSRKNCKLIYIAVKVGRKRKLISDSENDDDQNRTEQKAKKALLDDNEEAGPSGEMEQVKEAPVEMPKANITDFDDGVDDNRTGT